MYPRTSCRTVAKSCLTLWNPVDCRTPGFPVLHHLKPVPTESVMPSVHLFLCHPLLLLSSFQASGSFPVSQLFTSGGRSIGASAAASVLPMNIQGWFPLGLTGLISLQSMGLSKLLSTWMNVNLGVQYLSFYEDFVFLESFRFTADSHIPLAPHIHYLSHHQHSAPNSAIC